MIAPKQGRLRPPIDYGLITGILGGLITFLGLSLLIPLFIALHFNESSWLSFLMVSLLSISLGLTLFFFYFPSRELRMREAFLIVSLTWLLGSLIGALPFMLSGSLTSFTDAVFETMSGFSTTGATILGGLSHHGTMNPAIEELDKSLLFWRSLTHWLGGMGIILLTLALLPLLGIGGMQLFQAEYSGSKADKITPRIQETAKLLWTVYAGLTLAQFLLLWIHPTMDWFEAINHALSTLATGGFSTRNDSVMAFDSLYIELIIILFMFLAGINFAMHFRLFSGDTKSFFENQEVRFYTFLTICFILLISGGLWMFDNYALSDAFRYGSFQVLAILTTTGFGTDDYTLWVPLSALVLFLLFFTGGCGGSTSGGIKMIRILIVSKSIKQEFRQILHPRAILPVRMGRRVLDQDIIRTIAGFLLLYLLIFSAGAASIALAGYDLVSAMGASISSLGNIGPAWGAFGPTESYAPLPIFGKWVLILLMMIGRLELFTVLILFTPWFWRD